MSSDTPAAVLLQAAKDITLLVLDLQFLTQQPLPPGCVAAVGEAVEHLDDAAGALDAARWHLRKGA